jgi:hypothetical protein
MLIGLFLKDVVNITFRRPNEIRPIELTNIVNGIYKSDINKGDEYKNIGAGLL